MGHHYIPQRYLRNFESPAKPGFVWLHDKKTGDVREAAIKQVAQARDFYTPEIEKLLADVVEGPTNPVVSKLVQGRIITSAERHQLAHYIGTMLMRVPAHRNDSLGKYPKEVADYVERFRRDIEALAADRPDIDRRIVAERLRQLEAWAQKHTTLPPPEIFEQIRSPWPYENMVLAIESMSWRIIESTGPQFFMTSDNPAFYFGSYGLGNRDSELSFPLSTTHALHGSWQDAGALLVHVRASQGFVREVNRRLASTAVRAFYFEKAPWLSKILLKKHAYLSVLRWSDPPQWRTVPQLVPNGQRISAETL